MKRFDFPRSHHLERHPNVKNFLAVLGLIAVARVTWDVSSWLWHNFGPSVNLEKYGAGKGAFVVITGASEGIGRGLALEAARKGFNLIIISRTKDNLNALATEIKETFQNIEVRVVACDCSVDDMGRTYEPIISATKGINVTMLINNVGVASDNSDPCQLEKQSGTTISRIIGVNCTFLAKITAIMIPIIDQGRKALNCRGCIVNVSSFLSMLPAGYFTIYSSTKQFVNQFTECLRCEMGDTPIDVCTVVPAHVCSTMSKISTPSATVPDAVTYAKNVMGKLGRRSFSLPFVPHSLMAGFAGIMPKWFLVKSLRDALKPKNV
jgi:17beta-estradiol 17-dehydrogenase / very-long-chain 3-oxoacyl-CoA reductase